MSKRNLRWGDTVTLQKENFTIADLVILFVTFFGILYALLSRLNGSDVRLRKAAFRFLATSMVCYLLSYFLQIINFFLSRQGAQVKRGETFIAVFWEGSWQLADFVVLVILCRLTYYQFPLWGASGIFHATWRFLCMVFLTILAALTLFRWAVETASTILSLNGASSTFTQGFEHEAITLWTGYQLIYMLVSTFILLLVVYYIGRRTTFREKINIVEGQFFAIAILLWIRSVAETDVVVNYFFHGKTKPFYLIPVADALYGFPTVIIYVLFNHLTRPVPTSVAKSDILREGRRTARKELKRRRVDAEKGGPPLPTPAQLLAEIESKPLKYLPDQNQASMSSLTDAEVQDILSRHIKDVLRFREEI